MILVIGRVASPAVAQEPGPITLLDVREDVTFGERIIFSLEVASVEPIVGITFSFQENGALDVLSFPADLAIGTTVRATAAIDLRRYSLTPFARAFYWWRIEDQAGNVLNIDPLPFQYDDNRFTWEVSSRDNINVHTAGWSTAERQAMLDEAIRAQERIAGQLQAPVPAVIDIYAYAALDDLRAALSLHGRDAVEGYADLQHNVILVSPSRAYPDLALRRQIPHELAHIAIGHVVGEGAAPAWLTEGLALYFETEPDPDLRAFFEANADAGALYALDALCAAFPLDRNASALAYAQSYEVVRFIENRYGPAGIRALLAAYAQGATCEGGVAQGLGIALSLLERDWLLSLDQEEALPPPPSVLMWVALLAFFVGWPAIFLTFRRSRRRHHRQSSRSSPSRSSRSSSS